MDPKKSNLTLLAMLALLFVAGPAAALSYNPFLVGNATKVIGGVSYTFTDRSGADDQWNTAYGGYLYKGASTGYTGYYLGTVTSINNKNANDSVEILTALLNYYLNASDSYSFIKINRTQSSESGTPDTSDILIVNYSSDFKSGTWDVTGSMYEVSFYSLKGSTEFALYFVDPSLQFGNWTTDHLLNGGGNPPAISHITVSTTPVPEPATMLLFGTGLAGMAGLGRRRMKKA